LTCDCLQKYSRTVKRLNDEARNALPADRERSYRRWVLYRAINRKLIADHLRNA
jgi:hypothetical protein